MMLNKLQPFRNKYYVVVAILFVLVLWMLSGVFTSNHDKQAKQSQHNYFKIEKFTPRQHTSTLKAFGILEASDKILLTSIAGGRVLEVFVQSGTYLKKGDVILKVEDKSAKERLARANIALEKAQLMHNSISQLYNNGSASKFEMADATEKLELATAELKDAKEILNDTFVKAPFNGFVDFISVEKNDVIGYGTNGSRVVGEFYKVGAFKAKVYLSQTEVAQVSYNTPVTVSMINGSGKDITLNGTVTFISKVAAKDTKAFLTEITINDNKNSLMNNIDATVTFSLVFDNCILVPKSALSIDSSGNFILKSVEDNKVKSLIVKAIFEKDDYIGILHQSALNIITVGAQYLTENSTISEKTK
ncbi:efflux RND transporter periplasmic adaptor subunit [Candidatus Fokinia crypta]|uniref:Efflux RND transporter periplasmic adaptor subunit protein n=1 Tax=Candidatus Fokinia crypta TaxID=1920990 RepID=A0ABZ0UTD1_9RICK|nr:efflux RND transporter periplasmic adaptor subunit [Candidatus Fokinia cryptica]WPX98190.1 Efflux RND transporter periplasmic adaptor subunit protein [Candidatus Fokinia cryptica]